MERAQGRFEGRVALVTGAAAGIGRATAERLAAEGASVACVDVDSAVERIARETAAGASAHVCDVGDRDAVPRAVDAAVSHHGGLDVLVNVAGVLATAPTHEETLEQWDRLLAINLTGAFVATRSALPALLDGGGAIVNVASSAAVHGHPWMAAYAASKGGLVALTRTLAIEYGRRGVRANAVCPAGIETAMSATVTLPADADLTLLDRLVPLDRMRGPEVVAGAVAFLASDDAVHVNGAVVPVDGAAMA